MCHVCFNDNEVAGITSDRAEAEGQGFSSQPNCEAHLPIAGEGSVSDEEKIRLVSEWIAYAHQVFYPRGRFVFLRSLLTMLNKQRAVPNKEMAEALDMSDLAYRVAVYRMKQNVQHFRERLLKGETLRLDDEHQQMADHINHDFINLYPTLFHIYLDALIRSRPVPLSSIFANITLKSEAMLFMSQMQIDLSASEFPHFGRN